MKINYIIESYLSDKFHSLINRLSDSVNEIRLRRDKPICFRGQAQEYFFNDYMVTDRDIEYTLNLISDYSIYAYNSRLAQGYITIKGGCRIGVGGNVISENNLIKGFSSISSLNIRIPRQIAGCSKEIFNHISKEFKSTLIISPPACGKTTLLRDMVRELSNYKYNISIIDERSEIAFLHNGTAENDIGSRTDIIDGCNKKAGILMAIRGLAPEIIAVDEIGKTEDINAIFSALCSGVKVLCTIHGDNITDIISRQDIKPLINHRVFDNYIFLEPVGRLKAVYNKELNCVWEK